VVKGLKSEDRGLFDVYDRYDLTRKSKGDWNRVNRCEGVLYEELTRRIVGFVVCE